MTPKPEIFSILEQEENNFFENQLKEAISKNLLIVNEIYNNEPALHYALRNGKTNFAKILIEYNADLNKTDNEGNNALHIAAEGGLPEEMINLLVYHGASLKKKNKLNYTPAQAAENNMHSPLASHIKKLDNIFIAINGNHTKQIEQMLQDYPERLNEKNESGDTPLLHALKQDNEKYAIGFINSGAGIKSVDKNGNTALHLAAQKGYVDCIRKLLKKDSTLINQLNNVGDTPLIRAAASGMQEAVQELISRGANLDLQGEHNLTALHWAVGTNQSDIAEMLLAHNADTTLVSNYGTLLQIAQSKNVDAKLITILKKLQEKIDQENDLFKALDAGNEEAINKLIKNKNNLEKRNDNGDTPLLYCLKNKKLQKHASKLIAVPVDLNAQDNNGNTALHLAAQNGLSTTIKKLLKNPSYDKTITNKQGQTALMLAAQQKNQHAINPLIKAGMQLDAQDNNGKTALHYAVEKKNQNMTTILINAGASIDIQDKNNKTPLQLAPKNSTIVKALQGHKTKIELENNIFYAIYNENEARIKQLLTQDPNNLEIRWNGDTPLLYCLKNNKLSIALAFIQEANANLLAADDNGNTALHVAADRGYDIVIQTLLERNIDANIKNKNNVTALHCSAQQGHLEIAKMLVQKNADVNALDDTQSTPLHWAAYFNQPNIIKFLAQQPEINLNLKNNNGLTPFMSAAHFNKPEAAFALLQAGAALDETINTAQFSEQIAQIIIAYKKYNDIFDAIDQKETNRIQILIDTNKSNLEKRHFNDNDTPLLYCIKKNEAKFTKYAKNLIIDKKADITAIDRHGNTPLHCACGTGDIEIIKAILNKNAPIDAKNSYNQTPLIIAAFNNQTDAVNTVLIKNPSVNQADSFGNTALHYAAIKNNDTMVKALLTQGADVYAKNNQGKTPADVAGNTTKTILQGHQAHIELENNIFHAINTNNTQRVKELLKDPAARESKLSEQTPLFYCLNNNKPEIALMCIDAGVNIETQDAEGSKLIHMASYFGFADVVAKLLDRGADINQTNNQKLTPLHFAAEQNKIQIASILIDKGANVDAQTLSKETPLHLAATQNHTEMVKLLLTNKASIDLQNTEGQTALHLAVAYKKPEAVQVLIENNSSMDIKDKNEKTPLDLAQDNSKAKEILIRNDIFTAIDNNDHTLIQMLAKNKHNLNRIKGDTKDAPLLYALRHAKPEIALSLIQYGANIDAADVQKYNALHFASQHNYFDIAQALTSNDKLINAQNTQDGNTPLHFAIMYADINMVSLLLVADALFDIKNNMNKTAFELAKDYNKTEVVQLIESIPTPLTRGFFKIKYRLNNLKKKLQVLGSALSELRTKLVD